MKGEKNEADGKRAGKRSTLTLDIIGRRNDGYHW